MVNQGGSRQTSVAPFFKMIDMELIKEDIEFKRKVEGIDLEALDNAYKKAWGVTNTQPYYKGKDSLYKFAEEWELNAWEFDIIKRVVRCRHKGQFASDLKKTKDVIDIYLKEFSDE